MKTLSERVERLAAENKEYKVNNSMLTQHIESSKERDREMTRTLEETLKKNLIKIDIGEKRIQKLTQQMEDQRQEFTDKQEEGSLKYETQIQELTKKNTDLQERLDEIAEFIAQKEKLELDFQTLRNELAEKEKKHQLEVSAADREKALEVERQKIETDKKIRQAMDTMKTKTKDQLDTTTKKTIMENEQYYTELLFQGKECERLMNNNKLLVQENAKLKRNLNIHKDLENELARRTHVYQKLIKKMQQRQSPEETVDPVKDHSSQQDEDADQMKGISKEVIEEAERLKRQNEGLENTVHTVRKEFQEYRKDHATLTQLQDQSTRLIIGALYKLKNQRECEPFPPATYDDNANWSFTNMTARQKEYFFRVLLEKLNNSMCSGCFPVQGQSPSQTVLPMIPAAHADSHQQSLVPLLTSSTQGTHTNFSNFLWSVANTPPIGSTRKGKDIGHKAIQTETDRSDICFKEGIWNPDMRTCQTAVITPQMVCGEVRGWGDKSATLKGSRMHRGRVL